MLPAPASTIVATDTVTTSASTTPATTTTQSSSGQLIETSLTTTPTDRNPLGAKGIGEAATVGSTPAVQNAVVDAVSARGVRHMETPLTPERIWRALDGAG